MRAQRMGRSVTVGQSVCQQESMAKFVTFSSNMANAITLGIHGDLMRFQKTTKRGSHEFKYDIRVLGRKDAIWFK